MALLSPLEVILFFDGCIRPPNWKMIVCVEPHLGLFFRINTAGKWQTPVKIDKNRHSFLQRDSHIECGEPLDIDDYIVQQSIDEKGILGKVHKDLVAPIYAAVMSAKNLSASDKEAIRIALGC